MDNLRKQLLQSGLANKKQAKRAEHETRQKQKEQRQSGEGGNAAAALAKAAEAKRQQAEADRARSQAENEARRAKERLVQLRDMIAKRHQPGEPEVTYNFAHGAEIHEVPVSRDVQRLLAAGKCAVVCVDERYYVLPADAVVKIQERAPEWIACWHRAAASGETTSSEAAGVGDSASKDAEELRKRFPVPDDLVW
jgi:hypothetical protein